MSVQRAAFTRMVNAQCELRPDIFERGCNAIVTHTHCPSPKEEDRLVGEQKSSPFRRSVASARSVVSFEEIDQRYRPNGPRIYSGFMASFGRDKGQCLLKQGDRRTIL
jgi:hypothetical protein